MFSALKSFFLVCLLFVIWNLLFITNVHSQEPLSTSSAYQPIEVSSIPQQSPMYANLMVNNLLHAFSCLMAGASPIGQPCVDYLNGVPVISSVNTSGGLLGAVANLNTIVIANPPIRTGQYLATLGDSLGITKEAHAQVGGSGAGVLEPILKLWQVSRNIAYIAMIIIFVIIGLMVMFRQRINPQTVITAQAALPGLVIGLIMITFSYFLASLLTDTAYLATNLVGYYFTAASDNPSNNSGFNLAEKTADENVLTIFGKITNGIGKEDITSGVAGFFNGLVDPASRIVRLGAAFAAYQFGSSVGPAFGAIAGAGICAGAVAIPASVTIPGIGLVSWGTVPVCATIGSTIGGLTVGGALALYALADPPAVVGLAIWIIAIIILIYTMFRLLLKLVNNFLSIIFLTITAPFHFLAASLPGRQEIAVDWIRNMLCNILAFPGVMAVFYFVNYLLGPVVPGTPFQVGTQATVAGTTTLPLLGGLDLSFIRILLAFGALVATPAIPDIICEAIGKVGRAGGMIEQAISGNIREGRGYMGQAQGAAGAAQRDIGGLGALRT